MRIKVNGRTVLLFSGATARDAARKYLLSTGAGSMGKKTPRLRDRHGHDVAPDGELSEGDEIVFKPRAAGKKKNS